MQTTTLPTTDVSILGLGMMGRRLVELYQGRGLRVTVWNRSAEKAAALAGKDVHVAASATAALQASPISLMIVANDAAVREVLGGAAAELANKALVQLTTVDPATAREGAAWAKARGGTFLSGAIQAAPAQMGQPDTPILFSGDLAAWRAHRSVLDVLGGGSVYLGEEAGAASTMDLATLSWVYGAFLGFVHGAKIASAEKLDVAAYGKIVRDIAPSFGAFFQHEASVIASGDYRTSQSPMQISIDATRRLLDTARSAQLSADFPAFVAGLFDRAARAGLAGEEVAALIKVM